MNINNKILVLFAHPAMHKSRVNCELIRSIEHVEGITIHKLYDEYPDFHIDVKKEQELLLQHDIIVWQYPFYWYSMPALLKEWFDLVLEHGFAYGSEGKALKGKRVFSAISAGGRKEAYKPDGYNKFTIKQLLAPVEQSSRLCNMFYLPPMVIHGTHLLDSNSIKNWADTYLKLLVSLRDNIFDYKEIINQEYISDIL